MPNYHRSYVTGGTYFFVVKTFDHQPILTTDAVRPLLHAAIETVKQRLPFMMDAICLLPTHIHCIWTLPENDSNYSLRWGEIKRLFSSAYRKTVEQKEVQNPSHRKRGEVEIWQRRFWEHTIQDEEDYARHLDYIHYNPVKHGLVSNVSDWPWSSFSRFVSEGFYPPDWGSEIPHRIIGNYDFGE